MKENQLIRIFYVHKRARFVALVDPEGGIKGEGISADAACQDLVMKLGQSPGADSYAYGTHDPATGVGDDTQLTKTLGKLAEEDRL